MLRVYLVFNILLAIVFNAIVFCGHFIYAVNNGLKITLYGFIVETGFYKAEIIFFIYIPFLLTCHSEYVEYMQHRKRSPECK